MDRDTIATEHSLTTIGFKLKRRKNRTNSDQVLMLLMEGQSNEELQENEAKQLESAKLWLKDQMTTKNMKSVLIESIMNLNLFQAQRTDLKVILRVDSKMVRNLNVLVVLTKTKAVIAILKVTLKIKFIRKSTIIIKLRTRMFR
jgi:hypothetical protein